MKITIYPWIWKWHFLAGIFCLPIVLLLSITGSIYLFKDSYEKENITSYKTIEKSINRLTFQEQWYQAEQRWNRTPTAMVLPTLPDEATEFTSGRFSHKSRLFIHPYSGEVTGEIIQQQTGMHKIRKLHGELLLSSFGTRIVELVASWLIVLLITGVYIFWPRDVGWKGLFRIRFTETKRILYRDIHAVLGFWFSSIILLILIGGLPWTTVFGSGYKWVQEKTHTGFPAEWQGRMFASEIKEEPLLLDDFVAIAKALQLDGVVSIHLPKSSKGVFSISNTTSNLSKMEMYHFDQYSGVLIHRGVWEDIGLMMKIRLWVMTFHQGQFGTWNFVLVLLTSLVLSVISITAILSYLKRKRKGKWSVPKVPFGFKVNAFLVAVIILLGILLPLFGFSILVILIIEKLRNLLFAKKL